MVRKVVRVVGLGCLGGAWVFLTVLALLGAERLVHFDRWFWLVGLIAVSPWLWCLAWIVAAAAAAFRQFRLAAVALVLAVGGVVWVLPPYFPIHRAAGAVEGAPALRILDANVRYDNPDLTKLAGEISRVRPDVVALEELSPANLASLRSTGVLRRYRWRFVRPTLTADGYGLWSDRPMTGAELWHAVSHLELRCRIRWGQRWLAVDVVHTDAPRAHYVGLWRHELAAIAAEVRAQPVPLVVAGDLNATTEMYEFRQILDLGLKDAATESGDGWQMTWSQMARVFPPLVRIDHVLYSRGLTVTSYDTADDPGSDHRLITTTLASSSPMGAA